jgi:hypothetical protein
MERTESTSASRNGFEAASRMRKVAAILAVIPPGTSTQANDFAARILEVASEVQRNGIAARAGVNPPSAETWAAVVRGVRDRLRCSCCGAHDDSGDRTCVDCVDAGCLGVAFRARCQMVRR